MDWHLMHTDVSIDKNSDVLSKSYIVLEQGKTKIELCRFDIIEDHFLGSKRALVDAANILKRLAHEMETKADGLK